MEGPFLESGCSLEDPKEVLKGADHFPALVEANMSFDAFAGRDAHVVCSKTWGIAWEIAPTDLAAEAAPARQETVSRSVRPIGTPMWQRLQTFNPRITR